MDYECIDHADTDAAGDVAAGAGNCGHDTVDDATSLGDGLMLLVAVVTVMMLVNMAVSLAVVMEVALVVHNVETAIML